MASEVHLIKHPLIDHKLSELRAESTPTVRFRALLMEISRLMAFELFRGLETCETQVMTPMVETTGQVLRKPLPALVPVLRAGNGLIDGLLDVLPEAPIGHVGLARDEQTLQANEYYLKLPPRLDERHTFMLDPMLATGHSSVAAAERILAERPKSLSFACLVAAPEGIAHFHSNFPDVPIFTAAIDDGLNEKGYILPGLGDAGDRLYGTQ